LQLDQPIDFALKRAKPLGDREVRIGLRHSARLNFPQAAFDPLGLTWGEPTETTWTFAALGHAARPGGNLYIRSKVQLKPARMSVRLLR